MITVEVTNDQSHVPIDDRRLRRAVETVLLEEAVDRGRVGVAVVDDSTISELHRKYLELDEPTDVLSFLLERTEEFLEGEVVVSAETAGLTAPWYDWPAEDELLLYVIHGTLHLLGYDDGTPEQQETMRGREVMYLDRMGVKGRFEERDAAGPSPDGPSPDDPSPDAAPN